MNTTLILDELKALSVELGAYSMKSLNDAHESKTATIRELNTGKHVGFRSAHEKVNDLICMIERSLDEESESAF